ncbi:MAG: alpha/beta fold hydrolase [Oscillospiraceae bacterium]|nr:alpha/beta fold hydrolase [Oscillospiraceae bacterium]
MKHQEIIRIVPGAKTAVLFLHGIVGTPNHFVGGVPITQWVPEDWSFHNLLLPGHGKTVEDFAASNMKQWRCAARRAFCSLAKTHERVYIVAHSMGTLFAMELAVDFPDKIPALFLLGVPLRPHVAPSAINGALRLALGMLRPGYPECAIEEACGTTPTEKLWKYIPWLPRFLELFAQIARTEKKLDRLTVPTVAYQSRKDELVNGLSARALRKYPVDVRILEESTHFYYSPEDTKILRDAFETLILEK